jgi:hypothetical protein
VADRIEFSCQATPIETLSQDQGTGPDVLASETFGHMFGTGTVTTWTVRDATGGTYGYTNGTPYYLDTAIANTSPNALPSVANISYLYIKNTGYIYSSSSGLGSATTNYITVRALKGDDGTAVTGASGLNVGEQPVIASLEPGAAIMLPMPTGLSLNSNYYGVHSTTSDGTTAASAIVAMEFFIGN